MQAMKGSAVGRRSLMAAATVGKSNNKICQKVMSFNVCNIGIVLSLQDGIACIYLTINFCSALQSSHKIQIVVT